jgi:hypothetical protein
VTGAQPERPQGNITAWGETHFLLDPGEVLVFTSVEGESQVGKMDTFVLNAVLGMCGKRIQKSPSLAVGSSEYTEPVDIILETFVTQ